MTEAISIATSSPYLTQYLGAWAILESAGEILRDRATAIDWNVHMAKQAEQRAAVGSAQPSMYRYAVSPEGVAIIDVVGTLLKAESSWSDSTSTVMLRRTLRDAVANERVRAIMLRVDSPGGSVSGTEELAADIAAAAEKKPVGVYTDGMLCSAAYWIGAQANWIAANETAVIGSIGVVAVVYDQSARAAQQGIKVHVIRSAEAKGAGVPGTEITPKQLGEWQRMIDATHSVFVKAVAAGRGISMEDAAKLADARVHVGAEAKAIGMADHIESFDQAVTRLLASVPKTKRKPMSAKADVIETESKAEAAAGDVPSRDGAEAQQTGDASPEKGADMSQTTQQAPANSAPEQPKAATATEIKTACPGASSDFVLDCVEKGATLGQAKDQFIGWQGAQIRARDEEAGKLKADHAEQLKAKVDTITELNAKVAAAEAKAKNAGGLVESGASDQKQVATSGEQDPKKSAEQEWEANHANCQAEFTTKKVYVAWRANDIRRESRGRK